MMTPGPDDDAARNGVPPDGEDGGRPRSSAEVKAMGGAAAKRRALDDDPDFSPLMYDPHGTITGAMEALSAEEIKAMFGPKPDNESEPSSDATGDDAQ